MIPVSQDGIKGTRCLIPEMLIFSGIFLSKHIDTVSEFLYSKYTDTVSAYIENDEGLKMRKATPEQIVQKREEIINACEQLYKSMSFREITLKEIGNITSFSRPTIYNYFETKEEIFLALFQREYDRWNEDLTAILEGNGKLTRSELAEKIASSLAGREQLLKLLSMNNYDMEANSRQEMLTLFKKSYGHSVRLVSMLMQKFCPEMTASDIQNFIYIFFPFMFGIYPYTEVTEKQRIGMKEAGVDYVYQTAYELIYSCLIRLLGE